MLFAGFIARQLRQPSGAFGRIAMPLFFRRANARLYRYALDELAVGEDDRVLEIGFGSGESIERLAAMAPRGKVTGIDISDDMVNRAERRLAGLIAAGRVAVGLGDVARMRFDDGAFDRVLTANTIYFWPDPAAGMAEVRRVTAPGGRAVIAFRSKAKMQATQLPGFRLFDPEEVAELMRSSGFGNVRILARDADLPLDNVLAIGDVPRT